MKSSQTIGWIICWTGLCLGAGWTGAQTNPAVAQPSQENLTPAGPADDPTTTDSLVTRDGRIVVPIKPEGLDATIYGTDVDRPYLAARNQLSPELRERLLRFERYRQAFLEKQEALRKELQSATDEDRARLRESMARLRAQWFERMRELRLELKERQRELLGKLKEHPEVLRSAREEARDVIREQITDQRDQLREEIGLDRDR